MASISINAVSNSSVQETKKLVAVSAQGTLTTIPISSIFNKVDEGIVERVEEQVLVSVDGKIEERVEQVIGNTSSINKEDIDNLFTT